MCNVFILSHDNKLESGRMTKGGDNQACGGNIENDENRQQLEGMCPGEKEVSYSGRIKER